MSLHYSVLQYHQIAGQGLFVLTCFSYYSVLFMLRFFWLLTLCVHGGMKDGERERKMEKEEERKHTEVTEGEKCYIQAPAKKQWGSQNRCVNCSATWRGHMEIRHDIYHNLLEVNFSFGKETASLELPKSSMFYNDVCWEGMRRNLNLKNAQTTLPLPAKTDMLLVLWRENIQIYLLLLMSPEIFFANLGIRSSAD